MSDPTKFQIIAGGADGGSVVISYDEAMSMKNYPYLTLTEHETFCGKVDYGQYLQSLDSSSEAAKHATEEEIQKARAMVNVEKERQLAARRPVVEVLLEYLEQGMNPTKAQLSWASGYREEAVNKQLSEAVEKGLISMTRQPNRRLVYSML